jgi:hypothetical protein
MTCSQCGSDAAEGAAACPRCGARLAGDAGWTQAPPRDAGWTQAPPGNAGWTQQAPPGARTGAPAGRTRGAAAYSFDARRWTRSDQIVGGASIVVLISLFLPWFSVNLAALSDLGITAGNASESGTSAHGWLWFVFVVGLLILAYLVLAAGYQTLPFKLPLKHDQLLLAATGLNLVLVFLAFVLKPQPDAGMPELAGLKVGWSWGAIIGLLAAIAAVVPLVLAARSRPGIGRV